jgi:hypothetical protein
MVMKKLLGSAALVAVLTASGCSSPMDVAESRVAYLDVMCEYQVHLEAFIDTQGAGTRAETVRAAGPASVAELAAADALDGYQWDPSVSRHIPAISAWFRATGEMWAVVAQGDTPSETPTMEGLEANKAARDAVETALQIELPQDCVDR